MFIEILFLVTLLKIVCFLVYRLVRRSLGFKFMVGPESVIWSFLLKILSNGLKYEASMNIVIGKSLPSNIMKTRVLELSNLVHF